MHVLREARNDVRAMRAASALVEAGCMVSIFDVESDSSRSEEEELAGISLQHMSVHRSFGATRFERGTLFKAALLFLRSILRLLQTPADIYHACEVTALPACYIAARLRRKPLIFEAYELPLGDRPLSAMGRGRRLIHSMLTILLAHMVPRCAGVIAVSPPIVQEIRNRYAISRVSLIRNVPPNRVVAKSDRLRQLLGLGSQVRIALYQGYLQPDRSLELLVRAAAFLEPDIVIIMMGKGIGTTKEQLEALIASEGVAERVKIIPPVPYEELLDWTASADVGLIVCSPDYAPNISMLLPNKLFEYLMAGLPVLASQLDAVAEVLETYDVGRVVSSLAPAAVGAAINAMLEDPSALARMREHALAAAQQEFCWEKEKNMLIDLYQDVRNL
jgi:glycosyltransferase involved in cell wall biosynthesis